LVCFWSPSAELRAAAMHRFNLKDHHSRDLASAYGPWVDLDLDRMGLLPGTLIFTYLIYDSCQASLKRGHE
jgi:hypothetical protein